MNDLHVGFNVRKTGNPKPLVARLYTLTGNPKKPKRKLIATAFPLDEVVKSSVIQFRFPVPVELDAAQSYIAIPEFA